MTQRRLAVGEPVSGRTVSRSRVAGRRLRSQMRCSRARLEGAVLAVLAVGSAVDTQSCCEACS